MNVSREEARTALDEIDKAGGKMTRLQSYRHSSIFFVIWGLVWFGANLTTHLSPPYGDLAWPIAVGVGTIASIVAGIVSRRPAASSRRERSEDEKQLDVIGRNIGITAFIVFGFIFCVGLIMNPATNDQYNALISILFAFIYMITGVWLGWRLFAIGFITAAAILTGFYVFREYFDLWMAFVGGGALIAAGLWLRSA